MTMQTVVNVSCDGENCTHVRAGDANHWLVGVLTRTVPKQNSATYQKAGCTLYVASARELLPVGLEQDPNVKDFCGEECAIKWVSKMLAEIKK